MAAVIRAGCAVALGFVPQGEESEALLVLAEVAGAPSAKLEEEVVTATASAAEVLRHVRNLGYGVEPAAIFRDGRYTDDELLALDLKGG